MQQEETTVFIEQMMPKAVERLAKIEAAAPIKRAAELMSKPHTDLLIVCGEDGAMSGVLTKTDIVGHVGQCNGAACTARVDTIMTEAVVSCQPEDALRDVWDLMKKRGLQRIPVLDPKRRPIGIIYARDALQCLLGVVESDEALLRDYVMSVGYQ